MIRSTRGICRGCSAAKPATSWWYGEPDVHVDAVDLTTVHKAKGLEWRVVFVPSAF
jgi:superfamily I DNA/RNA helicase